MTLGCSLYRIIILTGLLVCVPLTFCVRTEDVIGCTSASTDYDCCSVMRADTLPNLDITYNCSSPDNVIITSPPETNRSAPFRLFHSNLCVTSLPKNLCDYPNIVSIRFKYSSVTAIPSLSCLKNLIALDLSNNKVEILRNDTFSGLTRLRYINLRSNRISYVQPFTFKEDLEGLMIVLLDFNRLSTSEAWPMTIKHPFCFFGLSYNNIERFSNEEKWKIDIFESYGPGMVDYSHNQFKTWVTEQLKIYGIYDLRTLGKLIDWGFDFRNNPWLCDCRMHEFLKLASNLPEVIWRSYFEVYCQSPPELKGTRVIDVNMDSLVCNVTERCPIGCLCQDQPERNQMLVDCHDRNMTRLPVDLPDGNLKLLFRNNMIRSLEERPYLKRAQYIDVAGNGLEYISSEAVRSLQQRVDVFNLSDNRLRYLPEIIQNIPFSNLILDNNSFICDCNSTWMFRWLRQQEANGSGITCTFMDKETIEVVDADEKFMQCHVVNPFPRVFSVLLGILAGIFILTVILLVVFRYEALVLMHIGLKRIQKPKDRDIDNDVFVSFEEECDMDRIWAARTLLPELEQKHNLKLYFGPRDMDPGSVIVDETIKSLKRSHSALIVLSSSYLENPAKVFEFSEAYNIMIRQKCGRVIIVRSSEVKTSQHANLNAFIRLKKYFDREDVKLFEKIVQDVEQEKSLMKSNNCQPVQQVVTT